MNSSATDRKLLLIALVLGSILVATLLPGCAGSSSAETSTGQAAYWPTDAWRSSTPEEQGISSSVLLRALDTVDQQHLNLHSLLVIRNGYLVSEVYYNPFTAEMSVPVASVTKSVTSALVGIAIDKGLIKDERAKVLSFFPNQTIANLDDRKQAMTIRDLVTMTAGLDYVDAVDPSAQALTQSKDWISFMLDRPMVASPGSSYSYSTGAVHLLSGVLAKATGKAPRVFANENLFGPLGIAPMPEGGWAADPQGVSFGGAGLSLTPRDMAKIGYLYLKGGKWGGRQIVSSAWVDSSTKLQTMKDDGYGEGYLWSLDTEQGSFMAHGAGGQEIYVLPSEQLVVVMTAGMTWGQARDFAPLKALFDDYIVPAVKSEHALPADAAAYAQLTDRSRSAVSPQQAVQPLPAAALQASGKTYQITDNQTGWQTIQFAFVEGQPQATVTINGAALDPPIGLDGLYRVGQTTGRLQTYLRGSWQPDGTLVVHEIDFGQLPELTFRVRFDQDHLSITLTNSFADGETQLEGDIVNP